MTTSPEFQWGQYVDIQSFLRRPVLKDGSVLFTIRNGQVNFPTRDLFTLPFSSISTIGYLNASPPTYTVTLSNLFSEDGVDFETQIALKLSLKEDATSRAQAAKSASRLSGEVKNAVAEAIIPHFKGLKYARIFRKESEVVAKLFDIFHDFARNRLPYLLEGISLVSTASSIPDVDQALRRETSVKVSHASDQETQRIRTEQFLANQQIKREQDIADIDHQYEVDAKKTQHKISLQNQERKDEIERRKILADTERQIQRADALNMIDLNRIKFKDQVDCVVALYKGLNGAEMFWLANTQPELYADIKKAEALSQPEMNSLLHQLMMDRAEKAGEHKILRSIANRLSMGLSQRSNFYYQSAQDDEAKS
jgi:hypothetical protein